MRLASARPMTLALGFFACQNSTPGDAPDQAELRVAFGNAPAIELRVTPQLSLLDESCVVRATDGTTTVFVNVPKRLASAETILVGVRAGEEATVWAQADSTQTPLTATSGNIRVGEMSLSSGGRLNLELRDLRKPEDGLGSALEIDGELSGVWP